MIIKASHFRGLVYAEVEVSTITLIAGNNFAGKTSLGEISGALLTGGIKIFDELTLSKLDKLVHGNKKEAMISIEDANGMFMSLSYPKGKIKTQGEPLTASRVAVGFDKIARMQQKPRTQFFTEFLGTELTYEKLSESLKRIVSKDKTAELWGDIQVIGCDGTHKKLSNKRREMKGVWEEYAGEKYGSDKAETYLPDNWEPDLNTKSEEILLGEVNKAKLEYEKAVSNVAVDESRLETMRSQSASIDKLTKEYGQAVKAHTKSREILADLHHSLHDIPNYNNPLVCPECNTGLFVEFMNKRFPTELHDSYAKEWADRFMSGNPVVYMDGLSKSIFKELLMR